MLTTFTQELNYEIDHENETMEQPDSEIKMDPWVEALDPRLCESAFLLIQNFKF